VAHECGFIPVCHDSIAVIDPEVISLDPAATAAADQRLRNLLKDRVLNQRVGGDKSSTP